MCRAAQKPSAIPLSQLFKIALMARRWLKKTQKELSKSLEERREQALSGVVVAAEPDPELLTKFLVRQNRYGDICQEFSIEELALALRRSGNHAATAVLLLAACSRVLKSCFFPHLREGHVQHVMEPTQRLPRASMVRSSVGSGEEGYPSRNTLDQFARTRVEVPLTDPGLVGIEMYSF
eukprot:Skav226079  [mRNA]  locus=scaffold211:966081:966617:- [translate_table: standard]